jgi:hypothetical protein
VTALTLIAHQALGEGEMERIGIARGRAFREGIEAIEGGKRELCAIDAAGQRDLRRRGVIRA